MTRGLDDIGGHGCRRSGDRCRLTRRSHGYGRWCGGDSHGGSARRQHWCDVFQSDSHGATPLISPIWTHSRIALQRTHVVTADTQSMPPTNWRPCFTSQQPAALPVIPRWEGHDDARPTRLLRPTPASSLNVSYCCLIKLGRCPPKCPTVGKGRFG